MGCPKTCGTQLDVLRRSTAAGCTALNEDSPAWSQTDRVRGRFFLKAEASRRGGACLAVLACGSIFVACGDTDAAAAPRKALVNWVDSLRWGRPQELCDLSAPEAQRAIVDAGSLSIPPGGYPSSPDCVGAAGHLVGKSPSVDPGGETSDPLDFRLRNLVSDNKTDDSGNPNHPYRFKITGGKASVDIPGNSSPTVLVRSAGKWLVVDSPILAAVMPPYSVPSSNSTRSIIPSEADLIIAVANNRVVADSNKRGMDNSVSGCDMTPATPGVEPRRMLGSSLSQMVFYHCAMTSEMRVEPTTFCVASDSQTGSAQDVSPTSLTALMEIGAFNSVRCRVNRPVFPAA